MADTTIPQPILDATIAALNSKASAEAKAAALKASTDAVAAAQAAQVQAQTDFDAARQDLEAKRQQLDALNDVYLTVGGALPAAPVDAPAAPAV